MPLKESLHKVDQKIREIETARAVAYSSLTEHLKSARLRPGEPRARDGEAGRRPALSSTRGRWGEIQLQRVVEMAGMVAYCDFTAPGHASRPRTGGCAPTSSSACPTRRTS